MPQYYPVMLNMRNRPAIVVGGDRIAAEKAKALWESGANVQVLSPTFCDELLLLAEQERFTLHRKAYEPGDLAGARHKRSRRDTREANANAPSCGYGLISCKTYDLSGLPFLLTGVP